MMAEDFSAHAAKLHITFATAQTPEDMTDMVSKLMTRITLDCVEAGTRLIGHVKCIAENEPENHLACSVTTHDGKVRCSGALERGSTHLDIVVNILQYGLEKRTLESIVAKRAPEAFGKAKVVIEDIDKDSCDTERRPIQIG
jgi:sugar diacid utilization regulator